MKKLYCARDNVSGVVYDVFIADSNADALRSHLYRLTRFKPKSDISVYYISDFDESHLDSTWKNVPLDSYHFDEVTGQALSKTDVQTQLEMFQKSREIQLEHLKSELEQMKKSAQVQS